MGSVAASGGYYIAAPTQYILAEPNTITGSIGVFGLIPNLKKFWNEKLGITWDRVSTSKYADLGNPNRDLTEAEERIIQGGVDSIYKDFLQVVAQGRNMSIDRVAELAQGRVYTGTQALELGLVDKIGTIDDAIEMAAEKVDLADYDVAVYPRYNDNLLSSMPFGMSIKEHFKKELAAELGLPLDELEQVNSIKDLEGPPHAYAFRHQRLLKCFTSRMKSLYCLG